MRRLELLRKFFTKRVTASILLLCITAGVVLMPQGVKTEAAGIEDLYISIDRVEQEDIDNAKNQRDQARAQASEAASKVAALSGEVSSLNSELAELNQLSEEQKAQYEIICEQLEAALEAKALALEAYIQAEENLEEQQQLFEDRISVMFEYQNKSTLEILLESDSIAGFFTNMEIITLIADADKQAIDEMQIALDDAELQRDVALQEAEDMQDIADEKQAQLDELESRIGVTTEALADVTTQLSQWEAQEDALEAYAASLSDTVLALQQQYEAEHATPTPVPETVATTTTTQATTAAETTTAQAGEGETTAAAEETTAAQSEEGTTTTTTQAVATSTPTPSPVPTATPLPKITAEKKIDIGMTLYWPVTCRNITSYYGYRWHPVYGTYKFHSGIDISGSGATYGSTISACADGTVIYVSTPVQGQNTGGSGYGNYCMISHGNGVVTLYAHARTISVSVGDTVSQGQKIGEVGSTGTSTGAHLHFEVRINGSTKNPILYLS